MTDVHDEPDLVTVATFRTVVESDACRSALVAAGFDVRALDEFVLRLDQSLGPGLGGVRLAVPRDQVEDAQAFLAAAESGELSAGMLGCPSCGATDIGSDRQVRRGETIFNYWLGVPVTAATVTYTCSRCGHAWE